MTVLSRWMVVGMLSLAVVSALGGDGTSSALSRGLGGDRCRGVARTAPEAGLRRPSRTRSWSSRTASSVVNWSFGNGEGPIEAMSATKSVVSLAIGRLIDDGKIKSLDQPVCDFYPEWKQGKKRQITVRHLLNHTSGLQNNPMATEIYDSPDFVQFALAADVSDDPGREASLYNNKRRQPPRRDRPEGVGRAGWTSTSGEKIFKPLGITECVLVARRAPATRTGWLGRRSARCRLRQGRPDDARRRYLEGDAGRRRGVGQALNRAGARTRSLDLRGLLWWRVVDQSLGGGRRVRPRFEGVRPLGRDGQGPRSPKRQADGTRPAWPEPGALLRKDEAIRKRL